MLVAVPADRPAPTSRRRDATRGPDGQMKSRHIVTLGVFLLGAVILTGVYLKLKETQAAETDGEGGASATVDSAREAASTTAASAFAAGGAVPVEGARAARGGFTLWVTAEGQAAAVRRAPVTSAG